MSGRTPERRSRLRRIFAAKLYEERWQTHYVSLSLILSLAVLPRQLAIKEAIVADRNKESTADQPTPSLHFALGRGVFEPLLDV